jgi:hypothetical protein
MLKNLRALWRRKVTDRNGQLHMSRPEYERRKEDRRKEDLSFDGPDRRRGKDRRQYVRRVMTGEERLPEQEGRTSR